VARWRTARYLLGVRGGGEPVSLTYFGSDGAYGNALEINTYDTTDWSELDWQMIEWCADSERQRLAGQIDGYRRLARSLNMTRHNAATIRKGA
jgi:hypothetical protein